MVRALDIIENALISDRKYFRIGNLDESTAVNNCRIITHIVSETHFSLLHFLANKDTSLSICAV